MNYVDRFKAINDAIEEALELSGQVKGNYFELIGNPEEDDETLQRLADLAEDVVDAFQWVAYAADEAIDELNTQYSE